MSACSVCSEPLAADAKSCPVCGTTVASAPSLSPAPSGVAASPSASASSASPSPEDGPSLVPSAADAATGARRCPSCGKVYGPERGDDFCDCGAELVAAPDAELPDPDGIVLDATMEDADVPVAGAWPGPPIDAASAAYPPPASSATSIDPAAASAFGASPQKPPAGTACLVVYSADKEPILYHALASDVTLIGRSDPIRGDFPDIDVSELFDEATSKRVSRKHALVIRSRETDAYSLRPLAKNTGTQVEKEMATELVDYPLTDGLRVILGGVVRMKFEIMK